MATERIDIVVREDGSRMVRRNLDDLGAAADKGASSVAALHGTSKAFAVQQVSASEVRIIARDEALQAVQRHAPAVVAADLHSPNSRTSTALRRTHLVERSR